MQCRANDWRALSARSVRPNEWRSISARHVRTNEWRMVSARHVVVDVTSQRARSCGETRVDNGLRHRLRNNIQGNGTAPTNTERNEMVTTLVPHPNGKLHSKWVFQSKNCPQEKKVNGYEILLAPMPQLPRPI